MANATPKTEDQLIAEKNAARSICLSEIAKINTILAGLVTGSPAAAFWRNETSVYLDTLAVLEGK